MRPRGYNARPEWIFALVAGCGLPDPSTPEDRVSSDGSAIDASTTDRPVAHSEAPRETSSVDSTALPDRIAIDRVAFDSSPPDSSPPDSSLPDSSTTDVALDRASIGDIARPPPPPPTGVVLYPADRTLSPITADIAARLNDIVRGGARTDPHEFVNVGASNTVNTSFMRCFATSHVDLDGRDVLSAAIDFFRAGTAGGTTPFNRTSLAATVGWSARSAIAGAPSPLDSELAALRPQQATVLFGTNDIQSRNIDRYASDMWTIADTIIAAGAVPLMTSIPPRADSADADLWVPRYNSVTRAIAQTLRTPYIDLNRELVRLPSRGMGPDGLHMNTYLQSGAYRGCVFTPAGLMFGFNTRNLVTLQTLDRVLDVTQRAHPAPDPDAPRMLGRGEPTDAFVIASLPFVDGRDTSTGGTTAIARYPSCMSTADESGAEFYYRMSLERRTRVRAMVFVRGATDVDLHLLDRDARCVQRADRVITTDLEAGTWTFVVDTYVSGGVTHSGPYLFSVLAE